MARLGDIVSVSPSRLKNTDEQVWLLNLDLVEQKTGNILAYNYVPRKELKGSIIQFDTENVLYSKLRPNLNKVVLPLRAGYATSEMLPLRPNVDIITREYLAVYLRSNCFVDWATSKTTGAKMPRLATKDLLDKDIPLPPLTKQRQIVAITTCINQLIFLYRRQLAKLDELVKVRFVEMFGDISTNKKGWDIQPLGKLCTIVRGGSPRPIEQFLGGDVPWIKIGDATVGESIYIHSTKEHIIQEGISKSRLVKAGSLIFANCGVSLGFARIITFDCCIHDGWLAMEDIDPRLDKVFLLQALNQTTEHFRKIAPSGTQPNLNTAIMKAYQQIVPPIQVQKEFVSFVSLVDKSKAAVQSALDKAQLLFDSLMQKYFG